MRELSRDQRARIDTEKVEDQLKAELLQLPNLPDVDLPVGLSETDNRTVRVEGDKPELALKRRGALGVGRVTRLP